MASLPKTGESIMKSGKYKGYKYKDIPDEYFLYMYNKGLSNYRFSQYIFNNIINKSKKDEKP